jgi:hypothetical protein
MLKNRHSYIKGRPSDSKTGRYREITAVDLNKNSDI